MCSIFLQFRYATLLDIFLMLVGAVTGIIHGSLLPMLMLVFGELTDAFIYQTQTEAITSMLDSPGNQSCGGVLQLMANITPGTSFTCIDNFNASLVNTLSDGVRCFFGSGSECLTDDDFIDIVNLYSIYFLAIAVAVFVFGYLEITFFQMACERQVRKIRLEYYWAILKQNIGWFDNNPSGELASRLNE